MKRQQWTVVRRQVSHPAAERRWDRAYQLLLATPAAAAPGVPAADTPTGAAEESRHARSRLRPGIDAAPGPGPND
jgi:hypothetical protein